MSEKYVKKYVKKFIPVEALQISNNPEELRAFLGESGTISLIIDSQDMTVVIHTLEGDMTAHVGDYIIKGIKGEFYPCRKDIFEESYEEVNPMTLRRFIDWETANKHLQELENMEPPIIHDHPNKCRE